MLLFSIFYLKNPEKNIYEYQFSHKYESLKTVFNIANNKRCFWAASA